jgi:hypothetical protein
MTDRTPSASDPNTLLEQISTRWPLISDPGQFVLRYAPAIRRYLGAILSDPHEADEASQDFLVKALSSGFSPERVTRGRFRDYLKAAVRNAAITRFRRRRHTAGDDALDAVAAPDDVQAEADRAWLAEWRGCLLDRVWQSLELHERRTAGNCFYSAVKLASDDPQADSPTLAGRLSEKKGKPITPEAFRQQLSRGRRQFASLLVDEVKRTIEQPTKQAVLDELSELGLTPFVKPYLKGD